MFVWEIVTVFFGMSPIGTLNSTISETEITSLGLRREMSDFHWLNSKTQSETLSKISLMYF